MGACINADVCHDDVKGGSAQHSATCARLCVETKMRDVAAQQANNLVLMWKKQTRFTARHTSSMGVFKKRCLKSLAQGINYFTLS